MLVGWILLVVGAVVVIGELLLTKISWFWFVIGAMLLLSGVITVIEHMRDLRAEDTN
jgi:hypothetical protein